MLATASLLCALALTAPARPFPLMVGDLAPPVRVAKFVKGAPVARFDRNHVYVVEFWATWCGPCKDSIPHLTVLQSKYKGKATILGVSIWEPREADVAPFVKEWAGKMGYTVARDLVENLTAKTEQERSRESVAKGFMSKRWMVDSGWDQSGIPCAFLVDRSGRVAWIGDPLELDEPLREVIEGTYDLGKATAEYAERMELQAFARKERGAAQDAIRAGKPDVALEHVEKILAKSGRFEDDNLFKFEILLMHMKQPDRAAEFMQSVAPNVSWNIPMNMAAQMGHDAIGLTASSVKSAIEVCVSTLKRLGKDHTWPLMNAAQLYHRLGDKEKAVEFANRALRIAKANDIKRMGEDRDRYAAGGGSLDKP